MRKNNHLLTQAFGYSTKCFPDHQWSPQKVQYAVQASVCCPVAFVMKLIAAKQSLSSPTGTYLDKLALQ